jgi:hypothetical protein
MIHRLRNLIVVPLALMENGTFTIKLETSVTLALFASTLTWVGAWVLEQLGGFGPLIVKDAAFVRILFLCLFLDLLLGAWKNYSRFTFNWKKLYTGLMEKVFVSFAGMVIFNALSSVEQLEALPEINSWFILTGKLMNLFYVGGSALSSMYVITGGKFPPVGFMQRLDKFNRTLNVDDLTGKQAEAPQPTEPQPLTPNEN